MTAVQPYSNRIDLSFKNRRFALGPANTIEGSMRLSLSVSKLTRDPKSYPQYGYLQQLVMTYGAIRVL
jgi:hypothetical protein